MIIEIVIGGKVHRVKDFEEAQQLMKDFEEAEQVLDAQDKQIANQILLNQAREAVETWPHRFQQVKYLTEWFQRQGVTLADGTITAAINQAHNLLKIADPECPGCPYCQPCWEWPFASNVVTADRIDKE